MTHPEARPEAVAVTEPEITDDYVQEMIEAVAQETGFLIARDRFGFVPAVLRADRSRVAAQVRSAQANEMIGEVERLTRERDEARASNRRLHRDIQRREREFVRATRAEQRNVWLYLGHPLQGSQHTQARRKFAEQIEQEQANARAAEARAAKAVEVLRGMAETAESREQKWEDNRRELSRGCPAENFTHGRRKEAEWFKGALYETAATLLSDYPAPEPGVEVGEVGAAFCWAMDEIDRLSNRLCGFAYPQGMAMLGREDQHEAYVAAVYARRALQTPADGGRDGK